MRHFASGDLPRIHPASQRDHERVGDRSLRRVVTNCGNLARISVALA
jgi:hypothetical protein